MTKKQSHGGKRKGSGRPRGSTAVDKCELRKTFGTRLKPETIDWIKSEAKQNSIPASRLIEKIIYFYRKCRLIEK